MSRLTLTQFRQINFLLQCGQSLSLSSLAPFPKPMSPNNVAPTTGVRVRPRKVNPKEPATQLTLKCPHYAPISEESLLGVWSGVDRVANSCGVRPSRLVGGRSVVESCRQRSMICRAWL